MRVDPSWLVIALLVTYTFWSRFSDYGNTSAGSLVLAVAAAALFFGSVLAHELGHALEARHQGLRVGSITLFILGGVTETGTDVRRPRDEFALSAVGPWVSIVLAALFGLVTAAFDEVPRLLGRSGVWVIADPLSQLFGLLAWLNVGLGVFNLLPGAPLDGGRVLRSVLWAITRDRGRAIRWSGRVGQLVGVALVLLGVRQFTEFRELGGVWTAVIGVFLLVAAGREIAQSELQVRSSVPAETLARPLDQIPTIAVGTSVADALDAFQGSPVVAVRNDDGEVVAIITAQDLLARRPNERSG